jgi:hypothetical protein
MLKYRLFFGVLMTVFFTAVVIFDGWLDGSLTASTADDKTVQGTILCVLVAAIVVKACFEFSKLAAAKNLKIFAPVSIIASILFASTWYWLRLIAVPPEIYLFLVSAFSLSGLLLWQYVCYGTSGIIANCGANCFSIVYLGVLSGNYCQLRGKLFFYRLSGGSERLRAGYPD